MNRFDPIRFCTNAYRFPLCSLNISRFDRLFNINNDKNNNVLVPATRFFRRVDILHNFVDLRVYLLQERL